MVNTVAIGVNVTVEVHDAATGELVERQEAHNLVVNAGLNLIRDLLDGDAPAGLTYMAYGTGTTAVAASQTALVTEVFREAVTQRVSDAQSLTVKHYLAAGSANSNTLAEIGIFNAGAAGTMFARVKLASTIVKTSSVTVTVSWAINLAAS